MNAVEHLRAVWPAEGLYCIARGPFKGTKSFYFKHSSFAKIEEAASFATRHCLTEDVFFAVHTLKGLVKETTPEGREVERVRRIDAQMREARVFYGDVDCGEGKPYPSKDAGRVALIAFCTATRLPLPMVVSSGRGLHLYWRLTRPIDSQEWRAHAQVLQRLADFHGFEIDRACTIDTARLLRVVGTFNRKNPEHPLKVRLLLPQEEPCDTDQFLALLAEAAKALPSPAEVAQRSVEPPSPRMVAKVCPTFVRMVGEAPQARGVVWMNTNLISLHTTGGAKLAHKLASAHPEYSFDETQAKLDRMSRMHIGPPTCGKLQEMYGADSPCPSCAFYGVPMSSPVVFARRLPEQDLPADVPPPQLPYLRTRRGVEFQPPAPPDAPVRPAPQVICHFDFYPTAIIDEVRDETKGTLWTAVLPLKGAVSFRLPADAYTNEDKLVSLLVNKGVVVDKRHAKNLGGYMSHYIRLLQAHRVEQVQADTVGWTADYKGFIAGPEGMLTAEGLKPVALSPGLGNVVNTLTRKGTLEAQVAALGFFDRPEYIRQQFMILCALGAPLLYMTNHFGVIVNWTGPSGASKTTTLHAAAGLWGQGEKYTMGGTDDDATTLGRAGRIRLLGNLPVCIDEITLMPAEQIKRMAMSITQSGDRVRLGRSGQEQTIPNSAKSTLMLTTSNHSAHALMSSHNQAGNAGSMRVLEVVCARQGVHSKTEADALIRTLRENHGWIGRAMMDYVVRHQEAVTAEVVQAMAEVDRRAGIDQSERYWGSVVTIAVTVGRHARRLGLLPFDPEAVLTWAVTDLLPAARRVVRDAYATPIEVLHGYIESISNTMLVVSQTQEGPGRGRLMWVVVREPKGPLRARLETDTHVLYLAPQPLRDYCDARKLAFDAVIQELVHHKVVTREKMKLTRHIDSYVSGLNWNFRVDLAHEMMAGLAPIEIDDKVVHLYPGKTG